MTFGNNRESVCEVIVIKVDNKLLMRVEKFEYLGIILDFIMKWENHIENIISKT